MRYIFSKAAALVFSLLLVSSFSFSSLEAAKSKLEKKSNALSF